MPAKQPPRPAPKAAKAPKSGGGKGASRGGAKGGAKGGVKGAAKGGAKGRAGGARKAAPPPKGVKGAKGKQPPPGRPSTAEQQRQRRIMLDQQRREREARWWAINQAAVNTLHSTQHHAAGGEAIGTVLNGDRRLRWRTSHAVGAITLLILAAFFASMALGAQSVGVGVLAFLCLAGCIAFVTIEHSARWFPRPVPAPMVGEHRLEDLIVEEDPPKPKSPDATAPSTMEAFDDLFEEPRPAPEAPAAAPAPQAPEPEPVPEAKAAAEPAPEPEPEAAAAAEPVTKADAAPEPEAEPARAASPRAEPRAADPAPPAATVTTVAEAPAPQAPQARAPMPPRQRTAPEDGPMIPDNISELLLSEGGLDDTDVTDVAATLVVADLRRSIEFYADALGLQIVDRTDEAAVLEAGFGKILLWERPDAPPGEAGIMHLTFEVGDLDATFAQMNEAGVEFLHLPRTALLGQNYELRAASFRDPDGHGLAITEHRER